jgi:hypothetical protein
VRSLAECTELRKLDVRGCRPALNTQMQELMQTCPQLADPKTVEAEVHELHPSMSPGVQVAAAGAVCDDCTFLYEAAQTAIASRIWC